MINLGSGRSDKNIFSVRQQYMILEYWNILRQKIMYEELIKLKFFNNVHNFSWMIFWAQNISIPQIIYYCLYFYKRKFHSLPSIFEKVNITAKFHKAQFDKYATSQVSDFSFTSYYLIWFITNQTSLKSCKKQATRLKIGHQHENKISNTRKHICLEIKCKLLF